MSRLEVVRVVLHEGGATRESLRGRLERAQQQGRLPVALGAEAVAVGHQPLDGQAGKLAKATEVFEVGREGGEPTLGEELAEAGLDPGVVAQAVMPFAGRQQLRSDVVQVQVLGDELVHDGLLDCVDDRDEIVDTVGVHRGAEAELGLDLVAFGDGDVAHVVAEAGQSRGGQGGPTDGSVRPRRDTSDHVRIGDVPGDGLAANA